MNKEDKLRLIRQIEEIAANTWPAEITQQLGNWRLRGTRGVTKRANSVGAAGPFPDGGWMNEIASFYHRLSLPVLFQVSDASPPALDEMLDGFGYVKLTECSVLTASCREIAARLPAPVRSVTVRMTEKPDREWLDSFLDFEGFPASRLPVYERMFSSIGPLAGFARIYERNGTLAGLGTVVVERGWAGLTNIVISPDHRQKGIGSQLIRALTDWSAPNGAQRIYLQVVDDNEAAQRLYQKAGFNRLYGYHYRMLDR